MPRVACTAAPVGAPRGETRAAAGGVGALGSNASSGAVLSWAGRAGPSLYMQGVGARRAAPGAQPGRAAGHRVALRDGSLLVEAGAPQGAGAGSAGGRRACMLDAGVLGRCEIGWPVCKRAGHARAPCAMCGFRGTGGQGGAGGSATAGSVASRSDGGWGRTKERGMGRAAPASWGDGAVCSSGGQAGRDVCARGRQAAAWRPGAPRIDSRVVSRRGLTRCPRRRPMKARVVFPARSRRTQSACAWEAGQVLECWGATAGHAAGALQGGLFTPPLRGPQAWRAGVGNRAAKGPRKARRIGHRVHWGCPGAGDLAGPRHVNSGTALTSKWQALRAAGLIRSWQGARKASAVEAC
jgi:hypothetical protein